MWTKTDEGEPTVRLVDFGVQPSCLQPFTVEWVGPEAALGWTAAWRVGGTGASRKVVQDRSSELDSSVCCSDLELQATSGSGPLR